VQLKDLNAGDYSNLLFDDTQKLEVWPQVRAEKVPSRRSRFSDPDSRLNCSMHKVPHLEGAGLE
jgi:hypothetical protein